MINSEAKILIKAEPFRWVEIKNIFTEGAQRNLFTSYPKDNYRTIYLMAEERQYHYDARALVSFSGKIENQESLSPSWREFANYLVSPDYRKFVQATTGVDLSGLPFEANIYKYSKNCFMDAHTDLPTKVLTQVFYFNDEWKKRWGGCFVVLKSKSENDIYRKVPPIVGNSVMIIRSDNSWHSVEKTKSLTSRRCVTVTFYTPDAKSPMWVDGEKYETHSVEA